jgi:hypothetical protein
MPLTADEWAVVHDYWDSEDEDMQQYGHVLYARYRARTALLVLIVALILSLEEEEEESEGESPSGV